MSMLGIIGGSGLYDFPGLEQIHETTVDTPFGQTSSPIVTGTIGDTRLAFLARHGRGHTLSPSEVPYRANVYALRNIGATHLLSISAVGSLQEAYPPGSAVVPDQIIDRSLRHDRSFFSDGVVAHIGLADPFCASMRRDIIHHVTGLGGAVAGEGTYLCIEGPQFSTRAESMLHRSWNCAVVGMTAMPEARLAREAGLCYGMLAMVTDYDVWHESEADVSVELLQQVFAANVNVGREAVRRIARSGLPACDAGCSRALDGAIITAPDHVSPAAAERVALFVP